MKKYKLDQKEIALIIGSIMVIICIVVYFFVYEPIAPRVSQLNFEKDDLQRELDEKHARVQQMEAMERQIEEYKGEINSYRGRFFSLSAQERFTMYLHTLEQQTDIYFKSISYKLFSQFSCNNKVRFLDTWEAQTSRKNTKNNKR